MTNTDTITAAELQPGDTIYRPDRRDLTVVAVIGEPDMSEATRAWWAQFGGQPLQLWVSAPEDVETATAYFNRRAATPLGLELMLVEWPTSGQGQKGWCYECGTNTEFPRAG
jgi:hypothetical protein